MQPDELYESWKRRRARTDVPADFAARVMAALPAPEAVRGPAFRLDEWFVRLLSSPLGRVALCALGCLALVLRMGSVVALFLEFAATAAGAS